MDEPLKSTREGNLSLPEVLKLAGDMDVTIYIDPETPTFKGGKVEGEKVILVPEGAEKAEEDVFAMELLHELGHIRFTHFGLQEGTPKEFAYKEIQANKWALSTKSGYTDEQWASGLLPGITEDMMRECGMSVRDAWETVKKAAGELGISRGAISSAYEELKTRGLS